MMPSMIGGAVPGRLQPGGSAVAGSKSWKTLLDFRDGTDSSLSVGGRFTGIAEGRGTVMNMWEIFPLIAGYERVGRDQIRLYVEGPTPAPSFTRQRGVRTPLFRLYAGQDAQIILAWLDLNRAWQVMRVPPPYSPELGVRAVLLACEWHGGSGSAMLDLARTRVIADDAHRGRLQDEVRLLIETVLENPVRDGEFGELQSLEDTINTAPHGVVLATVTEVVDGFFGSAGESQ